MMGNGVWRMMVYGREWCVETMMFNLIGVCV